MEQAAFFLDSAAVGKCTKSIFLQLHEIKETKWIMKFYQGMHIK
ncbi:Uncharacterised protein [Mycobacteroides abscessus subsp. abscessus]|nr:Uncharacterised protein [Mycobacteroides abscessus subsp. abscessus]